ncbi:MAG TPA: hypothetical protein VFA17_04595 [Thermoplasmata archaeon]|jgi:hypothetical protein|nr:hypothetical protein [Thermoplasmata archaeon]
MGATGTSDLFEMDSLRVEIEKKATQGRGLGRAWILFLAMGLPAALLAALGPLTMAGIYIEPLRPLWRPWPPDVFKPFIGIAVFAATLAYLAFRSGRLVGLRTGTVAALAALRNVLERRAPMVMDPPPPAPPAVVEVAAAPAEQPPTPPPPPPDEPPKIEITP